MSDQTPSGSALPTRKWLGPVLLVSLVINLFLVGLLATGFVNNKEPKRAGGYTPLGIPHHVVARYLTDDERQMLRASMREKRGNFRPLIRELHQSRKALSEALAADPYQPDAAKQAFATMRNAMDALASQSQGALVEAFSELTPESRDKIAEALARGRRGDRGRREGPPDTEGAVD